MKKIDDNICISHIRRNHDTGEIEAVQTNEEHSIGVANLAHQFADEFGMGDWGYMLGMLHDKGKEKKEFQEYIRDVNGISGHNHWTQEGKAHAYVGALLAQRLYGQGAKVFFGNPLSSHHRGLYDYAELDALLLNDIPVDVSPEIEKKELNHPRFTVSNKDIHHLSRVLFSCLVDADFLDTERFMDYSSYKSRQCGKSIIELLPFLDNYIKLLTGTASDSVVNRVRKTVQDQCRLSSVGGRGFYSLTVPTGGGKTLASLIWAMHHAVYHGMKRIIIAIPYTSIIVQTALILKHIFGDEYVLEHHSNFDPSTIKDRDIAHKAKLATENWDYPIIVTTNVQLFESMFSNRTSDCRKLHNIANSVIILDEVQTLPTGYLMPIVDALKTYQSLFGVSVFFTTASQPLLTGIIQGCNPRAMFPAIETIKEVIPPEMRLHEKLKRVKIEFDNYGKSYEEVAEMISGHSCVLCIVNTRRDAQELFSRLPEDGRLHLSRMMCPAHVSEIIEKIKQGLKDLRNQNLRVVATQLVEAGVDLDFPVVFRQEAGLDSILQAAGRCNREGHVGMATTKVFSLSKEHPLTGNIKDSNNARLNLVDVKDWFAPEVMMEYFIQLYCQKETFDKKNIAGLLYKSKEICFETASNEFKLIEDSGVSVIVNWHNSMELVERLKHEGISYALMKQLSQYSVSINNRDFKKLQSYGAIEEVFEGIYVVPDQSQYSNATGLCVDNHWIEEILMA